MIGHPTWTKFGDKRARLSTSNALQPEQHAHTRDRPQRWLREAWRNSAPTTINERVGLKYVNGAEFESVGVIKSPGVKKPWGKIP
jgi:hypothetical protein